MQSAAQQLSQWIEQTHPGLYDVLYGRVQRQVAGAMLRRARLRGFGDDGFDYSSELDSVLQQTAAQPLDLSSDIAPAFQDTDFIASQYTPESVDIPTLSSTDLQRPGSAISSTALAPSQSGGGLLDAQTDNSGGFLQSIGSGIADVASSVGHFLTSPQGAQAITGIASAYFQLQNNKVNAQMQGQVLQAQIARAQSSQSPLPIVYARAPDGSMVPVYTTSALASNGIYPSNMPQAIQNAIATGQAQLVTLPDGTTGYTLPSNLIGGLSNTSLSNMLPWLLLLGGALLLTRGHR